MRWTVVGATGMIGRALCEYLHAQGDEVTAVSRRGAAVDGATASVRWDPDDGPIPFAALQDADAVVNLAGAGIGDARWTSSRKKLLRSSRITTTRMTVNALARDGAPRILINASAVGYYGTGEAERTETAPAGDDFLAVLCTEWEAEARRAEQHGVRVICARLGMVLSDKGGILTKQQPLFAAYLGGPLGGGNQWQSWIHIDDLVVLLRYAGRSGLSGPVNATSPCPVRQKEFARALGAALGKPARFPTPAFALRLALGEMSMLALEGQRVIPQAATRAGFNFMHPDIGPALEGLVGD